MICFKCGAPASMSMNGMVILSCSCFPIGVTKLPTRCPLCHEVVHIQEYHRCPSMSSAPAPVPAAPLLASQEASEISQEYAKRICDMLKMNIAQHKETCDGCKMLGRSCFEILPSENTLTKWQKKAEGAV